MKEMEEFNVDEGNGGEEREEEETSGNWQASTTCWHGSFMQ